MTVSFYLLYFTAEIHGGSTPPQKRCDMNKCVYKLASGLWLWVIKSDLLMANSAKTCTLIHIEEVVKVCY